MSTEIRAAKIQELRDQTERAMKEITELETHIAGIPYLVEEGDGDKANEYWFAAADIHNRLLKIIDADVACLLSDLAPYEEPPYDANEYEWSMCSLDDARHVLETVKTSVLWWDDKGKRGEYAADFIEDHLDEPIRDAYGLIGEKKFDEAYRTIQSVINDVKVLASVLDHEEWPSAHSSVVVAQSRLEQAHDLLSRVIQDIKDAK